MKKSDFGSERRNFSPYGPINSFWRGGRPNSSSVAHVKALIVSRTIQSDFFVSRGSGRKARFSNFGLFQQNPDFAVVANYEQTLHLHWMLFVLAYPEFAPQTAFEIDRFRSDHEPERAKLVPPHITLVFGVKDANIQGLISLSEAVGRRVPKLTIAFSHSEIGFDPFEKAHKLFLICEEGKDELIDLHRQLYDGPHRAQFDSSTPYQPHMTVATNIDPNRITHLDANDMGVFPIQGLIRSIKVVEFAGGRLNTLKDVALSV